MYNGFLNINKPAGITSHDVVNQIRGLLRPVSRDIKVGHAGTLDPLADGVLVLCIGDATRLSDYVMHTTKGYQASIKLGETTDTYDAEGAVREVVPAFHITRRDVEQALTNFSGDILQQPPAYSAIKQNGKKLYELARAGKEVITSPREVHIEKLELLAYEAPILLLNVVCGSGTYIRSLAHDIGQVLGVGAHLISLTRTFSGVFTLHDAIQLESLADAAMLSRRLISPHAALQSYPGITVSLEQARELSFGRAIAWAGADASVIMIYDDTQSLIAIGQLVAGQLKPQKVFWHESRQQF